MAKPKPKPSPIPIDMSQRALADYNEVIRRRDHHQREHDRVQLAVELQRVADSQGWSYTEEHHG